MPIPKYWIEYANDWRSAPMAYWVHVEQDGKAWRDSGCFLPEAPPHIPHRGYAVVCVEVGPVVLRFSSRAQIEECVRVLGLRPLPTTSRLCATRKGRLGPNGHWLSRLPKSLKAPRARSRVILLLQQVLLATQAPNPALNRTGRYAASCSRASARPAG
jgi:hypothetical protein